LKEDDIGNYNNLLTVSMEYVDVEYLVMLVEMDAVKKMTPAEQEKSWCCQVNKIP
jgi:hypothetical protein